MKHSNHANSFTTLTALATNRPLVVAILLAVSGCGVWVSATGKIRKEGKEDDPVSPSMEKDAAAPEGEQPVHACLDLYPGGAGPNEIKDVRLTYVESCAATAKPCFEAQTDADSWLELDNRHRTFETIVYRTTTQTNGEVPLIIQGPTNRRWRLKYAINQVNPDVWIPAADDAWHPNATGFPPGTAWTAPTNAGLEVGTRHLAMFRAKVQTLNDDNTTWSDPIDPLVILVPKRPNKSCSVTLPFYPVPASQSASPSQGSSAPAATEAVEQPKHGAAEEAERE